MVNFRRYVVTAVAGMVLLSTAGLSSDSWAQATDTDLLESEARAAEQSRRAAGRALDLRTLDSAPVTYQEVLRDPDNVALNFRFARTQVSRGNFRGASATLERILRLRPKLAPVRLLYAIVLFRLENLGEAEREFRAVAALDIPPEMAVEIDKFLDRIQLARRTTTYSVSLSLGIHLDTNKTSSPRSNQLLVSDTLVTVGRAEADIGYMGVTSLRVTHDLGYQEGHTVFGSLTYFQDDQTAEDSLDLQSFTIEVGGTLRQAFADIDVTPTLYRSFIRLSREDFLRETGGRLRLERALGEAVKAYTMFTLSTQTFHQISENATGSERNGRQYSAAVGGSYALSPAHLVSAEIMHLDKSAKGGINSNSVKAEKFASFQRQQLRLNHTWLLGGGQFLLNSFTYQRDRYEDADTFISNQTRRDDIFRYRLTYGAPLRFLFGADVLPEAFENITFTPSIEVVRSRSNINNNDTKNFKVQALLTKSWSF